MNEYLGLWIFEIKIFVLKNDSIKNIFEVQVLLRFSFF
jgi:hypothetical protein